MIKAFSRYRSVPIFAFGLFVATTASAQSPSQSLSSNGVTWEFDRAVASGTFVNGDPWIIGPVNVIGISNNLNSPDYTPKPGQNGSMLNPGTDSNQGYDSSLRSYAPELNAGLPNGKPVSPGNPLALQPGDTLISSVSWLWNDQGDAEPGTPRFNGGTNTPRPVIRSMGILTVLDSAPPEGSFRPAYAGTDKTVIHHVDDIDTSVLQNLPPPAHTPNIAQLEAAMSRTWVDHVHEYLGAFLHPSDHMPNYGRDMGHIVAEASLALQLDFDQLPGTPSKDKLVINMVQYGIDSAGIADNGGGWPANGGHQLGRKWPILMAGALLGDGHMLSVGEWTTRFQDDEQTFYVSQDEVDLTHSSSWAPDRRRPKLPYDEVHIGMPEWGIRHVTIPEADNRHWSAIYRHINGSVIPGLALSARLMELKEPWNHDAYFDYADRYMTWYVMTTDKIDNRVPAFVETMWQQYRGDDDFNEIQEEWL